MFGELHSNAQTINISYIFKTLRCHLVLFQPCFRTFRNFFLVQVCPVLVEISFSNLRVRIKCFVVMRMRICNTTMAVHGFRNSKKPVLWRGSTSICATISLGGKWILTK